jgi:iron complex outermembrane receptor protein
VCFDYDPYIETNSGGDALFAPEWTYSLSVSYEVDLGNGLYLTPRVNYSHTDEQFAYLAYSSETDTLDSRDLVHASVTLSDEQWKVELYGTNLTDEEYVSGQYLSTEFYGAPREYGVRFGVSF